MIDLFAKLDRPVAFTMLIDGACPLCRREAAMLARIDRRRRLGFVDIAAPGFDASAFDRSREQLMAAIHGVEPDGRVVTGVEVFRRAYAEVGRGWMLAWTAWPIARPIVDACYRVFARYRPRLQSDCSDGRCRVS